MRFRTDPTGRDRGVLERKKGDRGVRGPWSLAGEPWGLGPWSLAMGTVEPRTGPVGFEGDRGPVSEAIQIFYLDFE